MLHAFDIDAQIDMDAATDLAGEYRRSSDLRHAARTPELDVRDGVGSRAWQLACVERDIARVERGMNPATVAEARRLA